MKLGRYCFSPSPLLTYFGVDAFSEVSNGFEPWLVRCEISAGVNVKVLHGVVRCSKPTAQYSTEECAGSNTKRAPTHPL